MMIAAGIGLAAAALLLAWLSSISKGWGRWIDGLAVLFFFLMFVIVSAAVVKTLLRGTVFMTEVHGVLYNPIFLAGGAYIGPYTLSALIRSFRSKEA